MRGKLIDRLAEPQNLRRAVVLLCGLLALAVVLAGLAVVKANAAATAAQTAADDAQLAIDRVEAGRRIGSAITCAATSAVIDAGRTTIKAGAYVRPVEFARALEQLGLPPETTRKKYAAIAADAYARNVSRAVLSGSGVRGVVREDGTLDCAALRKAAKIAVP